jgi:hypothetical protein
MMIKAREPSASTAHALLVRGHHGISMPRIAMAALSGGAAAQSVTYRKFGQEDCRPLLAYSVEKLVRLARSNTSSKSRPLRMRYKRR